MPLSSTQLSADTLAQQVPDAHHSVTASTAQHSHQQVNEAAVAMPATHDLAGPAVARVAVTQVVRHDSRLGRRAHIGPGRRQRRQ